MSGKYKKRKIISQVSTAPQSENSPNLSSSSRNSLGTSDKSLNKTKKAPHGVISHLRRIQLMVFASAIFILSKIQHTKWLFLPYLRFEVSVLFFYEWFWIYQLCKHSTWKGSKLGWGKWWPVPFTELPQTAECIGLDHWKKKKRCGELQLNSVEQGKQVLGLNLFLVSTSSCLSQREFVRSKRLSESPGTAV